MRRRFCHLDALVVPTRVRGGRGSPRASRGGALPGPAGRSRPRVLSGVAPRRPSSSKGARFVCVREGVGAGRPLIISGSLESLHARWGYGPVEKFVHNLSCGRAGVGRGPSRDVPPKRFRALAPGRSPARGNAWRGMTPPWCVRWDSFGRATHKRAPWFASLMVLRSLLGSKQCRPEPGGLRRASHGGPSKGPAPRCPPSGKVLSRPRLVGAALHFFGGTGIQKGGGPRFLPGTPVAHTRRALSPPLSPSSCRPGRHAVGKGGGDRFPGRRFNVLPAGQFPSHGLRRTPGCAGGAALRGARTRLPHVRAFTYNLPPSPSDAS
jgi:hypothetical protein